MTLAWQPVADVVIRHRDRAPRNISRLPVLTMSLTHDWIVAHKSYLIRYYKTDIYRGIKSKHPAHVYVQKRDGDVIHNLDHVLRVRTVTASAI